MTARLTATYMPANSSPRAYPIQTYVVSGPPNGWPWKTSPRMTASPIPRMPWKWTAFIGVR